MIDRNWPVAEHNSTSDQVNAHVESGSDVATAGALLRHARERAGLHIGALAVSLKVPVKKLEALEADRLDLLPDVVFARALALSVCRALKVDPSLVLERLPQSSKTLFKNRAAPSINAPFKVAGEARMSKWGPASRRSVVAGMLLLLGALALIVFPPLAGVFDSFRNGTVFRGAADAMHGYGWPVFDASLPKKRSDEAAVPVFGAEALPAELSPQQVSANVPGVASLSPETALGAPMDLALANSIDGSVLPAVIGSKSPLVFGIDSLPREFVVFIAKSESWVEVTDAKGQVVLRRTLATGEAAGVSGALPLVAVVGRADATLVQVRGKPFELIPHTRNNVARFEVK